MRLEKLTLFLVDIQMTTVSMDTRNENNSHGSNLLTIWILVVTHAAFDVQTKEVVREQNADHKKQRYRKLMPNFYGAHFPFICPETSQTGPGVQ